MVEETPHGSLKVHLKYADDRTPAFAGLRRVSKPGLRVYKGRQEIPRVLGGPGHRDHLHPQGPDDRARGLAPERGGRGAGLRLVAPRRDLSTLSTLSTLCYALLEYVLHRPVLVHRPS